MHSPFREYGVAAAVIALCTALCLAASSFLAPTDLVMLYLVGTLIVALRGRRGPAVFASIVSALVFNFLFIPPRYTFNIDDPQHWVTFLLMLAVALAISYFAVRVKTEVEAARNAQVQAETERLRSSLLSGVSHELRTPLAAIIGSATGMLQAPADAGIPRRELLETIRDEAERMARLVHNLIETTRLESGARLKREPYPIDDVIGTALERLNKNISGRRVDTDLPDNLPLVPLDPVLMELVFVNLIENALRYAPGDAPIEISARERMDVLEVSVADRGPGLAEGDLIRVFEKFYRVSKEGGGAGLGLAICKAVVEAHGGSILAENRPGGGAAFRLTLPRKAAA